MTEAPKPVHTFLDDGSAVVTIGNLSELVSGEGLEVNADIIHRIHYKEKELRERWLAENTTTS
tara:strand:+ start:1950 stop:2138 length:189 start_codon:yes stop_codon:yes gene_type:complete